METTRLLTSGDERFTTGDLRELTDVVATTWTDAADLDWSRPAGGGVEWTCLATADHAVDCVYAPAFFLAAGRSDAYPDAGGDMTLGESATPATLVESLRIATRVLTAVVETADESERSIIFLRPVPTVGAPADFVPRAAMELILHAHDVAAGLEVGYEPPADLCHRLREHTRPWPFWGSMWGELGSGDDPWGDLLSASGRSRGR